MSDLPLRRHRQLRNSLVLAAGQALAQLVGAAMFLILARELGKDTFGSLAAIYGFSMFCSLLYDFGAAALATRELAVDLESRDFADRGRSRDIMLLFASCIASVSLVIGTGSEWAFAVVLALAMSNVRYRLAPLRATFHIGKMAFFVVLEKVLALISVIIILRYEGSRLTLLFICWSLGSFLVAGLARRAWDSSIGRVYSTAPVFQVRSIFVGSLHLGISSAAVGLQSLDSFAIRWSAGAATAGEYAAVGRWTQPMTLISQAVTQSAYSEMVNARSTRDAFKSLRISLFVILVTSAPILLVAVFAEFLVDLLLGAGYGESAGVLRLLALAVLFGMLNSPLTAFLQARGHEKITARVLVVSMPVQLLLMAAVAHWSGPTLAAGVVLTIQGIMFVVLALAVRGILGGAGSTHESSEPRSATKHDGEVGEGVKGFDG